MGTRFLVWRTLHALIVLFGVLTVVFTLLRLTPGDPVLLMVPPDASPAAVGELRHQLGFDQPIPVQFGIYLSQALTGDMGSSLRQHRPVTQLIWERFPATIELTLVSMLLAMIVAVPLGVFAATARGSLADVLTRGIALVGQAMPTFWLGILLIIVFAVELRILPTSGRGSTAQLILPSLTLGIYMMGFLARVTRASMLDVLGADYVRTARAKGLRPSVVVVRHSLRNALIPIVTVVGLQVGTLLGGAVITEAVFAWPGIGTLAITAIYQRDYPVVQGVVVLSAFVFVAVNFLVDLAYTYLDPQIRYA